MSEAVTIQQVYAELNDLKHEVHVLRQRIAEDTEVSDDDVRELKSAEENFKAGKTKRLM